MGTRGVTLGQKSPDTGPKVAKGPLTVEAAHEGTEPLGDTPDSEMATTPGGDSESATYPVDDIHQARGDWGVTV